LSAPNVPQTAAYATPVQLVRLVQQDTVIQMGAARIALKINTRMGANPAPNALQAAQPVPQPLCVLYATVATF